ncbi:hypothetical protein ACEPAF_2401 [Sanghuangporus sanghuang]
MENSNQVPTAPAHPGQANSAKVQLGLDIFSTPKALKEASRHALSSFKGCTSRNQTSLSCLLPRVDSADDAPVTNDGQDYADAQHDLNSSTLLEQQPQASEATATAESDDGQYLQNGGLGEKPLVEDSHVASVSEKSPYVDPHPPVDLSHPSTPPSSTLQKKGTPMGQQNSQSQRQ